MNAYQELHGRALARFGELVHSIRTDQWGAPTPCSEWDVRALVQHLVSETLWMPPLLAGKTIAEVGDSLDGDLLGEDPVASWDRAAAEAAAAIAEAPAEGIVHVSYGDLTAESYTEEVFTDLVIHGWDLARAIGGEESLDPESVELIYAKFKPMEDGLKSSGVFGPMIVPPAGASRQIELLAVFGRVG